MDLSHNGINKGFNWTRSMAALVVGVSLLSNVAGVYAAEGNFWKERNDAARRRTSLSLLAQLPRNAQSFTNGTEVIASLGRTPIENGFSSAKQMGWLSELVAPYGDIREVHLSSQPNAPLIVHLQDVHEVEEAQRNLAGLVEAFQTKRGISLIGLEGAVGPFDLDYFRPSSSTQTTRGLADTFLKLGYLTGPEVAGIVAAKVPTLWGIEDLPLYRGHIQAFERSESGRAPVRQFLATLSTAADNERETIYQPALRALDDHRRAYVLHRESLGDYVTALWSAFKGDKEAYPQGALLVKLLAQERVLDFKEVERQRMRLADMLAQRLAPADLDQLVKASLSYRSGRQTAGVYQRTLAALCRQNNIRLDAFGPLESYMGYVQEVDRLNSGELLEEFDRLEAAALVGTAETRAEKQLVEVFRGLSFFDKLTNHSLTPPEWAAFKKSGLRLDEIQATLGHLQGRPVEIPAPRPDLSPFKEFCAKAEERNGALVKNVLAKMRTENMDTAVLVAGGFHTEGMTAFMKDANASYVVVSPKLSKVPDTRPMDIFVRAPLPLDKLLAGDVIHLAYPRLTQISLDTIGAAKNASERRKILRQAWTRELNARLLGRMSIRWNKIKGIFSQVQNQGLRLVSAISRRLNNYPGKTRSGFQGQLFVAYCLIGLTTISAMILAPELALSLVQGPWSLTGEIESVLQSMVFAGFGGAIFVPGMNVNDNSTIETWLDQIKKIPDNDVLWMEIIPQIDSLHYNIRNQILTALLNGNVGSSHRMNSLFNWCEAQIRPDYFNGNRAFIESFLNSVSKSDEGESELARRTPRLLELLMGLVQEKSYFEIIPALKMMDQLLEASPQLERRGARPVQDLLRSPLTEIFSKERASSVYDKTHLIALLRFARKVGVDPLLCSEVCLRRLASDDRFGETFIIEMKSGQMGKDEAESLIGKNAESFLAESAGSSDSFLSSPEAQKNVTRVLAEMRGEKGWERLVEDFNRATDPDVRATTAKSLEGFFHNALDLLLAVYPGQREDVEVLGKLVPLLPRMKPDGFSNSLFLSGDTLRQIVANLTGLGRLLDRALTKKWSALDQIRPVIPVAPSINQVEVLGYTLPSLLGTWLGEESIDVKPVHKTWNNFAVVSADPTMKPDQEIREKSSARRRLLAIDEKGRSRFAALAGAPLTRRDAESLLVLVEQMYGAFNVLEQKKGSPPPASPPAWESLKQAIKNGVETLGVEEILSEDLQHRILDLSWQAHQWEDVKTLHQALNYMHQAGKELFSAAAKEAKVNATVNVGGITMSVANLSGNPLESQGRIVSKELRQFLRAVEKPGVGPKGSFELDEDYFKGSIPLGIHSVEFFASVAPPENGGGIKLSFLEWRPKEGNTLRLAFIEGVLKKLGFKTNVKEGMYLEAVLDMTCGAISQEQIERALFLVVRALYFTPDLNLKFDAVIQAKRQEEGLEMREAYAATQREFAELPDLFLAEESLEIHLYPQRLDRAYHTYRAKESERIHLRTLLNKRLSRCGLAPIPETIPFGQGVVQSYYTDPLLSALARGEVLIEDNGPVRNQQFQPIDDLAREALAEPDELMRMAAGLRTLTVETKFRPIGAVGELTAGECLWRLDSGGFLVLRGLSDPDSERLLYATATLFTTEGTARRLSLEELVGHLGAQGLTMGAGEEIRGPLRSLTENLLRAQPRNEPLPGAVHRGGRSSPGAGGTVTGVVTFDRKFHEKSGARGDSVLVVDYTTPSDFDAMKFSLATLTLLGNPETHSAITLRELHHPGVIFRGARWVRVDGETRLSVPVQRPHGPRLGEDGLWITPGMDVEEHLIGPGTVLLVNGERGVVSILSGQGVSELYEKWREMVEHWMSAEELVASVVSSFEPEVLEFALFLAIYDGGLNEPERQHFLSLLEESVTRMRPEDQQRFYEIKVNYLAFSIERTNKDLDWLADMLRWASTMNQISGSFSKIRKMSGDLTDLAGKLSLSTPRLADLSGLTKEVTAREKKLRQKSLKDIRHWSDKKLSLDDLPAVRRVLKEAERNGVPIKNPHFQRLAKQGEAFADKKRKIIGKEKELVYGLDKVNRDYRREVGGKFSNLGESEPVIRKEGAFVPGALAVTYGAFRSFLLEQGIKQEYDELAEDLDAVYKDPLNSRAEVYGQVQMKSQEMRDLIERKPIDSERALGKKILNELDLAGLGNVALILRSSGDMEDNSNAAYAGGARSFSNVSRKDVLKMLPKVWASFWLSRGVAYRAYQGMKQKDVRSAAIIQEMVNGDISGVMLTVNPSNGDDTAVSTAGYGLNEGIEKNLVDCDEYTVRKSDGELIAHPKIPRKLKKLVPNPDGEGTLLVDVPLVDQKRQVLSSEQIKWLVRIGNALENHYDEPRNIEYSFVGGRLAILQDRAVTTVPQGNGPKSVKRSKEGGRWPMLQPLYDSFGKSWAGQVLMPVLVEWVLPVGGIFWAMAHHGMVLTPELLVGGVLVYQIVWHLFHLISAPGNWKEKIGFAFSSEKRWISYGTIVLALFAAVYFNFGVSPAVLGAQIISYLSLPHLAVNSHSLKASLLGGPAEGKLKTVSFAVEIDALRERVAHERQELAKQRKSLALSLDLGAEPDVLTIAQKLAERHSRSAKGMKDKAMADEVKLLLASAYVEGGGRKVSETVQAYHLAQGMVDAKETLAASIPQGGEIALEVTTEMVNGKMKGFSLAAQAQWDRLRMLASAATEGTLKKPVRLILQEGVEPKKVREILLLRECGSLVGKNSQTISKSDLAVSAGKYSVDKFLDWLEREQGTPAGSIPVDIHLMDRNEWDFVESLRKNIRLLVDVLPGIVFDATSRVAIGIQRLLVVDITA